MLELKLKGHSMEARDSRSCRSQASGCTSAKREDQQQVLKFFPMLFTCNWVQHWYHQWENRGAELSYEVCRTELICPFTYICAKSTTENALACSHVACMPFCTSPACLHSAIDTVSYNGIWNEDAPFSKMHRLLRRSSVSKWRETIWITFILATYAVRHLFLLPWTFLHEAFCHTSNQ